MAKTVYYASVGPALTLYDVDVDNAALTARGTVMLPANIQYAWPHPSRRFLYVVSSSGGPGVAGDKHLRQRAGDRSGDRQRCGRMAIRRRCRRARSTHASMRGGRLFADRLQRAERRDRSSHQCRRHASAQPVAQPGNLDTGIYAHQMLAAARQPHRDFGHARQQSRRGQAGGSRRDQDVPLQ